MAFRVYTEINTIEDILGTDIIGIETEIDRRGVKYISHIKKQLFIP